MLAIARFDDFVERSRELSSRYVMSFGRAATDFGASIQISGRHGDVWVVTLHKASSSREASPQCVRNVAPLMNFRASAA